MPAGLTRAALVPNSPARPCPCPPGTRSGGTGTPPWGQGHPRGDSETTVGTVKPPWEQRPPPLQPQILGSNIRVSPGSDGSREKGTSCAVSPRVPPCPSVSPRVPRAWHGSRAAQPGLSRPFFPAGKGIPAFPPKITKVKFILSSSSRVTAEGSGAAGRARGGERGSGGEGGTEVVTGTGTQGQG